jgi:ATP-dependent helicase/nuclease subunit B
MGVDVEWVRYGPDAAEALRASIAARKGSEPLAPVTVIVSSNHVGVATRRLLASGSLGPVCGQGVGLAAVSFLTPYRLAELLGAPRLAAAGRRPVSTPVIAAALRSALRASPGLFAPVVQHPATETALVAAYRELREVSSSGLDAIARTGARAADVVLLHRAARAALEGAWYDEQDLMQAAADALRDDADPALGAVVVYLPQRISRHVAHLLLAVASRSPFSVLAGATGNARADDEVAVGIGRLTGTLPMAPAVDPFAAVAVDRTRIVLASDADDEVRAAVRTVIDAARAGTPLDRMAVLYAAPDPYARLAHEHLTAAGIAVNGPAVVPLDGSVAGRLLLDLLAMPERDFRRQDVFAWLSSAPLLLDGRPAPTTAWERLSRDAGVVAGRADWDTRLAEYARDRDTRADAVAGDADEPEWKVEGLRRDAERARGLRAFVLAIVDDLAAASAAPRAWGEHAAWARRQLDHFLGGPSRRERWPVPEQKAAEKVELALARVGALDGVEGPVPLEVFGRTVAMELESDLGRVGRFGDGVLVGSLGMGLGLDLDVVVVLGCAEGTLPGPVRDDSLLPDHERAAAADELPLRRQRVDREHREFTAVLAGARRQVLGVPRGDLRRSNERVPSRWVLDIASTLAGERWWTKDLHAAQRPWVEHVASFDAGLRGALFPATEQEHRLRTLMFAGPRRAEDLVAVDDVVTAHGAEVIAARRSDAFTRFDGNLAGLPVPSPIDTATSATRIERWAGCPHAYFVHDVLGVEPVENPEDRLRITAMDKGNLVHEALEQFVVEVLQRPDGGQPPHQPWSAADRRGMQAIAQELCAVYEARGLTGRPIFWRRDRLQILRELQLFLDYDDVRRDEAGIRPIAAELAFGLKGATVDAVPLELPDGRVLRFRGKADRVDLAADGSVYIVDYKTGRHDAFSKLSEETPDLRGTKLQLAVYGSAARVHQHDPTADVVAEYWFVSQKSGYRRLGYHVTDDVLARVGETLGRIVDGIEAGVFASHPTVVSSSPFVQCAACDPDALGVTELRHAWERKRFDPALAPYADLAEPLDDADAVIVEGDVVRG